MAWYYWKGRLDLLKNGGILWLLLCSVNRGRDRLKRLLYKKFHFKSLGKQVTFRSELCIRMQWKREDFYYHCQLLSKNILSATLHQPSSPTVFSLPPTLSPGSAVRDEPVTQGSSLAEASSHSSIGFNRAVTICAG